MAEGSVLIQTPRQRVATNIVVSAGGVAGYFSLGVSSLLHDLWGTPGLVASGLTGLILGGALGGVLGSDLTHAIQDKLNQQERNGK